MQIIERSGDFIEGTESLIIHGCNAQGMMGAGAAKAVRERLPFAYQAYREVYLMRGLRLGEVIWALNTGSDTLTMRSRIVANAITQQDYGSEPKLYVDYDAVRAAMRAVDEFCVRSQASQQSEEFIDIAGLTPIYTVGMPMIGAGLGGGSWSRIAEIITAESQHFQAVVYRLQ
jgi:O-acetyl-ADP-ribose deacetylase (regulator of RNase III)